MHENENTHQSYFEPLEGKFTLQQLFRKRGTIVTYDTVKTGELLIKYNSHNIKSPLRFVYVILKDELQKELIVDFGYSYYVTIPMNEVVSSGLYHIKNPEPLYNLCERRLNNNILYKKSTK